MTRAMAQATLPETKHTPPRWLTKQLFGSDLFVLLREEGVRTHRLDDKGQFSRDDAALIARAPDLLAENERLREALRRVAARTRDYDTLSMIDLALDPKQTALARARAALSEQEGK